MGTMNGPRPLVALLRDPPEDRRPSMERFADSLEDAFASSDRINITGRTVRESCFAKRIGLAAPAGYLTRLVQYPLAAARMSADIYHIVDQGYGHIAALLPRARIVATCHDLMLLRAEEGAAGFRGRRTSVIRYRWSTGYLRRMARVVCDSTSTKDDLIRLRSVPEQRIRVIPPGVQRHFRPLPDVESVSLRSTVPGARKHILLHVSSGHPYKNAEQTVRILHGLAASGIDACLVRVGRSLDSEGETVARELNVQDRIIELGIVSESRLVEVYNAADVLIFPSYYEGFGWPPLEAMACGTPVVVSSAPSLVEVVGDAGLITSATDTEGLVAAAAEILESVSLRRELRERGIVRAAHYSWERTAAAYEDVYLEVLAELERTSEEAQTCAG